DYYCQVWDISNNQHIF
nr:immunoglobulin light chain junction region [Macaca mulatta]MOW16160.1 immunoglobulin light chain junction region [Macaca mulatta]MOW16985.1 immunoglobulin light chain junction region [Macaca mulatta]MOW17291.1 immunoglobulin light chain junction region [Macaca mulatta]MOW17968.1 immunoglobulin light chain junction region [Macaca mulatta]